MIIDRETFLDIHQTLKGANDAIMLLAKYAADSPEQKQNLAPIVGELMGHTATLGEILRAVDEENRAQAPNTNTTGRA